MENFCGQFCCISMQSGNILQDVNHFLQTRLGIIADFGITGPSRWGDSAKHLENPDRTGQIVTTCGNSFKRPHVGLCVACIAVNVFTRDITVGISPGIDAGRTCLQAVIPIVRIYEHGIQYIVFILDHTGSFTVETVTDKTVGNIKMIFMPDIEVLGTTPLIFIFSLFSVDQSRFVRIAQVTAGIKPGTHIVGVVIRDRTIHHFWR